MLPRFHYVNATERTAKLVARPIDKPEQEFYIHVRTAERTFVHRWGVIAVSARQEPTRWEQLGLFDSGERTVSKPATEESREPAQASRRLSYSRVTRDPAVALSSATNQAQADDLRAGFASFVAGLSPERRAELRRRLGLSTEPATSGPARLRKDGAAA